MKQISEKVYCRECNKKTNQSILEQDKTLMNFKISSADFKNADFQFEDNYCIVKCNGCDNISFLREYGDEDQWEYDDDGERYWYSTFTVYPEEPKNKDKLIPQKEMYSVPRFVKEIYKEVVKSYNDDSLILCSVGLRMIIEGVCKDKGIDREHLVNHDGSNKLDPVTGEQKYKFFGLQEKINKLLEMGLITEAQSMVLHQIREMGNETAHEITRHDEHILRGAIEILENLLFNIYELTELELFNRKRLKQKPN